MAKQIVTGTGETREDRVMSGEGIRPKTLDEYIGQEKTKQNLKVYIEAAKLRGQHMGRPEITMPEKFPAVYANWQEGKITAVYAMEILGLKRSTFYRLAQEYKKRNMSEKDG